MTLSPGTRLGSYEVTGALGEGGMGEVYRARDPRLNRDVALKILPQGFAADAERLARFEREAQVLASLQHANIAAIYGIEESGPVRALVLELVEGPTLADRIVAGPLPVAEALAIARQIADAVGAAHDAGVIHRDLKPANIKVREDGAVKVLDFGLAKIAEVTEGAGGTERRSAENSPTLTARATQLGMIIGTAAYMAPEQARGRPVDRRADVWAFGVVLYEMLTGRRAFEGPEITDVLASVIKYSASVGALPADVPASVRRLLRRALEKDRSRRLDSMTAARLELDEAGADHDAADAPALKTRPPGALVLAGVAAGAAAIAGVSVWRALEPAPPDVRRFTITPDAGAAITIETNHNDVVMTPDGRQILYFSRLAQNQFVVRPLDRFEPVLLTKLGIDPRGPSISGDGRWVVFQMGSPLGNDAQLAKVPLEGGTTTPICRFEGNLRGASWGADERILFASTGAGSGIMRVGAGGGTPEVLTRPATAAGELDHFWPQLLPDGRHALFSIMRADRTFDIALLTLESKAWRVLIQNGTYARYAPTGHLVFGSAGVLKAVAFDLGTLQVRGEPIEILPGLLIKESGAADFAFSNDGTLVYLAGAVQGIERPLAWRDADGRETTLAFPPANYNEMRISPDERLAVAVIGQAASFELWLLDLDRQLSVRLTPPELRAASPVWSFDSRRIAFWSPGRIGTSEPGGIFLISATGTSQPERLTTSDGTARQVPSSFTPDGRMLLFSVTDGTGAGTNVMQVSLDQPRTITPVLSGPDPEATGVVSPNGRWLAYTQVESRAQVFIRPYPGVNQVRIPVTTESSHTPAWSADGRSLYFFDRNMTALFVADVKEASASLSVSPARRLTAMRDDNNNFGNVAVPPVKGRVLTAARQTGPSRTPEYRVILNWFEELKSRTAGQK